MSEAFDAFEDAVRRANREHRARVAAIKWWAQARTVIFWAAVAAAVFSPFIGWACRGFQVVGQ